MSDLAAQALARWGMPDASCTFVAGRENQVFKVTGKKGDFALRIRRPGLRSIAELNSELVWLEAMDRAGLSVPRPTPSASGALLESVGEHGVDMAGWLTGHPLGKSREPLQLNNPLQVFSRLGGQMARLHAASDAFSPPDGFARARWDGDGLLGDAPLWGRFWENPTLQEPTRQLMIRFRDQARSDLAQMATRLDHGLIHADLVRENILLDGDCLRLIDFDDGGYGYRLFDIATTLLKNRREPDYQALKASLIAGYLAVRHLDMTQLDLFMALRAVSYVGWVVPRMREPGSNARNARFVADAQDLCSAYLGQNAVT